MKTKLLLLAGMVASLHLSAGNPLAFSFANRHAGPSAKTNAQLRYSSDDDEAPKNVIKLNATQLIARNVSFQYERGFHKNLSGALGFSVLMKRQAPSFFGDEDPSGEGLRSPQLKGFAITPEFRFYPGRKEERQAPHGFYLGLYYRYAKYTYTSSYTEYFKNGKTYSYDLEAIYKGGTAGLMMGSQWLIGKHFSFDWWILGAGFGLGKFSMEASGSGFIMNNAEQEEVNASVEQQLNDVELLQFPGTKITTTSSSVKVTASGLPMLSVRAFGFCFGFSF